MKKNYFIKSLTLSLTLFTGVVNAQSLADVLCNLNSSYTMVTDSISTMYIFDYDGFNNIDDGGGDMYDTGNLLNTNITSEISYSDNLIIPSTDFGPNGQYFTREFPGLFVLAADIDAIDYFYISGNNGADSDGTVTTYDFTLTVYGNSYDVYTKQVSGAGDPSINQVMLVPASGTGIHSWAEDTDDSADSLLNISGTTRLYYFLFSNGGAYTSDEEITNITTQFIRSIWGGNSLEINASATEVCQGSPVTLSVVGASSFTWNDGVVDGVAFVPPTGNTTYTVSGTGTNGCANINGITISTLTPPSITLTASDVLFANDGGVFLTLNSGVFPFTYDWDNDGTGDFNDPQNLIDVAAGTYTVVVEGGNGCTTTATATVNSFAGIEENSSTDLSVYPNPATSEFTIELNGMFTYELVDLVGHVVCKGSATNSSLVSTTNLSKGTYIVNVNSEDKTYSLQIIKN